MSFAPSTYVNVNEQQYNPKPHQQQYNQPSPHKTMYTLTQWCAIYLNTQGSNFSNNIDNNDLLSEIPSTNVYLDISYEQTIIAEIESLNDEEQKYQASIENGKKEVIAKKKQSEQDNINKQNEKIITLMSAIGITDKNRARKLLEQNNWNIESAAESALHAISTTNVFEGLNNNNMNNNNNNKNENDNKSEIRIILPDNRQYLYTLKGSDTFWDVYSKLVMSVPELTSKPFTFILANGHKLTENEFDSTLALCNLVPKGEVKVQYV